MIISQDTKQLCPLVNSFIINLNPSKCLENFRLCTVDFHTIDISQCEPSSSSTALTSIIFGVILCSKESIIT